MREMSAAEMQVVIRVDEAAVSSLWKKLEATSLEDRHAEQATIFRVPHNIRAIDSSAYEPKIVSLGPYHADNERLGAWDGLKWRYFKKFLNRNPNKHLCDYLEEVEMLAPAARTAYSERPGMDPGKFVEMMLLDCCFVVELLLVQMEEKQQAEMRMGPKWPEASSTFEQDPMISAWRWALPLLAHDVMMLENQLPLVVLRRLLELASPCASLKEPLDYFFRNFPLTNNKRKITDENIKSSPHLLHLFHTCIVPTNSGSDGGGESTSHQQSWIGCLSSKRMIAKKSGKDSQPSHTAMPCARELREARVKFVKKEATSFLDISFRGNKMEIPQVKVDDETNSLLRNLIALEQCYPRAGIHVTTYAWFMDRIIDTPMDVALLRQHKIIENGLGNDEDVANVFNKLGKEVIMDLQGCYLSDLGQAVTKHCDNKCNRRWASLNHNYLTSPWAIISVFAAILLFLLTIIQTVFSVLSYFKQS
ncbi:unnamed protein product [Musa acuminata subsp. malaccensis]|uniref:(wild Malaysian banana) hypothetical protein n=1 Tax=Musa acuminata subsp. malaccensis TaxID=214687 RepID=A0A804I893_MUSAM|nr:unnamed protein product [Musa acuminata subsp. malaccensis]